MIRSILREFGQILPTGIEAVSKFARDHATGEQLEMPEIADGILGVMRHQLNGLNARIAGLTQLVEQHAWLDAEARRLMRMAGIGPITASAVVATLGNAKQFETGRDFAAWMGLTPINKSSGGKERLGRITKKGDRYIRKLLHHGLSWQETSLKRRTSGRRRCAIRTPSGSPPSQWPTNPPGSSGQS